VLVPKISNPITALDFRPISYLAAVSRCWPNFWQRDSKRLCLRLSTGISMVSLSSEPFRITWHGVLNTFTSVIILSRR
jgi:hypothetical protein